MRICVIGDINSQTLQLIKRKVMETPPNGKVELLVYTNNGLKYMEKLRDIILNNISKGIIVYDKNLKDVIEDVKRGLLGRKDTIFIVGEKAPSEILNILHKVG